MIRQIVQDLDGTPRRASFVVCMLAIVLLCCASVASAQAPDQASPAQKPASASADESPAQKYFTDVVLINQNGEKMRFYSDLLQGKVVIINSFFGTCQGSCLPMNRNLEKVQAALGDRVGKDVRIISISVDSTVDTPAVLKEYAKRLHAGPGWYFLSGNKENVDFALRKLGQFVSDKQDHLNIIIIGNERTGLWKKAFGLAQSDELVKVVQSVLDDQLPTTP
ncbi:MAG TPA: SCO family protein [Pyrinomonadaceae bacterium]|jgi:protein SCO1/2|nr:SCO family protein [Pyrinomonadaceae bacterium]